MYFEIICNALLNARNKIEYIINVQFELIEWFLYACWFLTSFKKSIQIFEKMLEYSFVFPGIDFITQLDACKKSAKKACQEQNNNQNMITTLESIYNHFLFHYYLIEQWKLKYSDLHNATIDVHELEIKIYEWVLIHYLLPIYICLFGYEENDQTFENLVKQLFEYKFEQNLIEQIINYLIETKYIVKQLDDKNLEILYKNVIKCCNTLVSTNIYLKENNKLKLKVKKMN